MQNLANKKRKEKTFQIGDFVLLRLHPYKQRTLHNSKCKRFNLLYYGPYQILRRIGTVAYHLDLPPHCKIHPVFHVSLLKPYMAKNPVAVHHLPATSLPPTHKKQPLDILDYRTNHKNDNPTEQALIHWEGFPPEEATWEDLSSFDPQLVQQLRENCTCQQPPSISSPSTTGSHSEITPATTLRETSKLSPPVILPTETPIFSDNYATKNTFQKQSNDTLNTATTGSENTARQSSSLAGQSLVFRDVLNPHPPTVIPSDTKHTKPNLPLPFLQESLTGSHGQRRETREPTTQDRGIPYSDSTLSSSGSGIRRSTRLQQNLLQALRRLPAPPRRRRSRRYPLNRKPT